MKSQPSGCRRLPAWCRVVLPAAAIVLCALAQPETDEAARLRAERARARVEERAAAERIEQQRQADIEGVRHTIARLSDPGFGGRAPGSPGLERAAEYIEDHLLGLGLEPAFGSSFRQRLTIGDTVEAIASRASFSLPDGSIVSAGSELEVLPYSGHATFSGPLSFVGYGIVAGPGTYLGFAGGESIEGHVVLILSHEPMDELGRSLWSDRGWSFAAPLFRKLNAVHRRGAGAVIVVDPPDHDPDANGSADPVGQTRSMTTPFEIPVVRVSSDLADRLLRAGDPQHNRGLHALTRIANRQGIVVELQGVTAALQTSVEVAPRWTHNIGAVLGGRGDLKGEIIVIAAHYELRDLKPVFSDSSAPDPMPAADDNASGVAAMLLIAEQLRNAYDAMDADASARSILFLALSGGDKSHRGSNHYVENPVAPVADHVMMFNLDAVGRYEDFPLQIGSTDSAEELEEIIREAITVARIDAQPAEPETLLNGDHLAFNDRGVPQLVFSTGVHPEHGSIADTADTIDPEGIVTITSFTRTLVLELAMRPQRLKFTQQGARPREHTPDDPARDRVRIGLIPSAGSSGDGMLVARVSEGSTASLAGFRPGDRVLEWNGQTIENAQHWVSIVEQHRPGDTVSVTIRRAGQTQTIEMTLESAKDSSP